MARTRRTPCWGTAERMYCQLILAANNERVPPMWTPRRSLTYCGWAWLIEGAAQYFAGQVSLFRPAVITRLREGDKAPVPAHPPGRDPARRHGLRPARPPRRPRGVHDPRLAAAQGGRHRQPRAGLRRARPRDREGLAPPPRRDPLPRRSHTGRRPASGHRRAALSARGRQARARDAQARHPRAGGGPARPVARSPRGRSGRRLRRRVRGPVRRRASDQEGSGTALADPRRPAARPRPGLRPRARVRLRGLRHPRRAGRR